jgi:2-iminobutanoate/2-iminopropanoate deaminase
MDANFRRAVHADEAPSVAGPLSHGVVSNGFLFCSGQIALDPERGQIVEGDVGEHTRRCLENLAAICVAAGAKLSNAVRVTVYATHLARDWKEINEAYAAFFVGTEPPARAAIGVAELPRNARVEIDAVVALSH